MSNFFTPVRTLLKGLGLSFLGFGLLTTLMSLQFVAATRASLGTAVQNSARDWLMWVVVTPLLFRLVVCYPLARRNTPTRVILHVASCITVIALCQAWESIVDPGFHPPRSPELVRDSPRPPPAGASRQRAPHGVDLIRFGSFQLPLYLMILSAAHAALFYRRDRERAASLARARLEVLTTQLQPHFLFNTLNAIAELVHQDPDKADAMITGLSEMLRMSLDANATEFVPLRRDAKFIERYFDIMQTRFGERLEYECNITREAQNALVPPFLLQPLVENAILHGIEPKPHGGRVSIHGEVAGDTLHIRVCDDGVGFDGEALRGEGIGLANTRARLAQLYGDEASINLRSNGGAEVTLRLPYRTV